VLQTDITKDALILFHVVCLPSLLGKLVAFLVSREDIKVNDFVLCDLHHDSA